MHYCRIAVVAALVELHDARGDVAVARGGIGTHGARLGERLEAELAVEPVLACAVVLERLSAMPDGPEVRIAPLRVAVVVAVAMG